MAIYVFGAYGTNNLGDDAIFLGVRAKYSWHRVVQIYVNYPSVMDAICYDTIKEGTFKKGDLLVIGGGGLLHCKQAVVDYLRIAKLAIADGAEVRIERIGAEGLQKDYAEETRELFSIAKYKSVRSIRSLSFLDECGISDMANIKVEKDFVYSLVSRKDPRTTLSLNFKNREWPTIGLVTAGNKLDDISFVVSKLLLNEVGCNIVHIPHSRAYVDPNNNDVLSGEYIWSNINIYYADRLYRYANIPQPGNPYDLFDVYKQMDGIIGYRYHSFVISKLLNIPVHGIVSGEKARAFFKEEDYGSYIDSPISKEELLDSCINFVNKIKETKNRCII